MLAFLKDHRADPKYRLTRRRRASERHRPMADRSPVARALGCPGGRSRHGRRRRQAARRLSARQRRSSRLVVTRQNLLRDAWLTKTGHKRPGIKPGLPLPEAEAKAKEINAKIDELAK